MPRPTKSTVRNYWVSVRLTGEDRMRLLERAQKACLSVGEYLRLAALAGRRKITRVERIIQTPVWPADVYHAVHRIGVNLNQVTRQLNARPDHAVPAVLDDVLTEIRDCIARVRDCYGPPR